MLEGFEEVTFIVNVLSKEPLKLITWNIPVTWSNENVVYDPV